MGTLRNHLEARVADMFGYSEAILFGRARSGVVALLDVLGLGRDAPFVMPSNLCSSLLLAVHSCGISVRLAGVSEWDGLAPDAALVETMREACVPGVVMPTHLYGFVQPYEKTVAYARTHGWFVLENDTVATRARFPWGQRPAFGDALLASFGYAKSIEAGGGGALLTDDASLANELRLKARSYRPLDDIALKAEVEFMLLERQLRNSQRLQIGPCEHDREQILINRMPGCRLSFPDDLVEPLSMALDGLHEVIEAKRQRVEMWNRFLEPFNDFLVSPMADCVVPWRLIRRVPGCRDKLVAALRKERIDAGTNFPPLTTSFPVLLSGQRYEGAEQWGAEVLNLWVSSDYDAQRMRQVVEVIGEVLSHQNESEQ